MIKTYSRLITFSTFLERFKYLSIGGRVGASTFGSRRYLNQVFYTSDAWRHVRDEVIIRDEACDLGIPGMDIGGQIYIHHLNPITFEDIERRRSCALDLENLICVSRRTHEAIHYGDERLLFDDRPIARRPGDTQLW